LWHLEPNRSLLQGMIAARTLECVGPMETGFEEGESIACQQPRAALLIVDQLGPLIVVGKNCLMIIAELGHPLAAPLA
jgi:hypothetical protein